MSCSLRDASLSACQAAVEGGPAGFPGPRLASTHLSVPVGGRGPSCVVLRRQTHPDVPGRRRQTDNRNLTSVKPACRDSVCQRCNIFNSGYHNRVGARAAQTTSASPLITHSWTSTRGCSYVSILLMLTRAPIKCSSRTGGPGPAVHLAPAREPTGTSL